MEFHFLKEDAMKYGVEIAILLYNLKFWIKKNKANGKNFVEGHYWTYNSYSSFVKLFPFFVGKLFRIVKSFDIKTVGQNDRRRNDGSRKRASACLVTAANDRFAVCSEGYFVCPFE